MWSVYRNYKLLYYEYMYNITELDEKCYSKKFLCSRRHLLMLNVVKHDNIFFALFSDQIYFLFHFYVCTSFHAMMIIIIDFFLRLLLLAWFDFVAVLRTSSVDCIYYLCRLCVWTQSINTNGSHCFTTDFTQSWIFVFQLLCERSNKSGGMGRGEKSWIFIEWNLNAIFLRFIDYYYHHLLEMNGFGVFFFFNFSFLRNYILLYKSHTDD